MDFTFGQWLKAKRMSQDLTQVALANLIGLKSRTIYMWERDKTLPKLNPVDMWILCDRLGVSLDDMVKHINPDEY